MFSVRNILHEQKKPCYYVHIATIIQTVTEVDRVDRDNKCQKSDK